VKPFDEPHPIRGGFCDPRMGDWAQVFHFGIDIVARDGTPVYAVAPGTVVLDPAFPRTVVVARSPTHLFSYWHVVPAVPSGTFVSPRRLLGYVAREAGHVHLAEKVDGFSVNPLRPGALTPYRDVTAPFVAGVVARRGEEELDPASLRGRVDLVADVIDFPELALPPAWAESVLTPARVAWRLVADDGVVVRPLQTVADCTGTMPANTLFWNVFAPGTMQNHPGQTGRYRYWLARSLDTLRYGDGEYRVQVLAADVRGNATVGTFPVEIRNGPDAVTKHPLPVG
jgi:hypothetical protein